nr:MAG TPA: hypothetical protein [Crassvirales sp.]
MLSIGLAGILAIIYRMTIPINLEIFYSLYL